MSEISIKHQKHRAYPISEDKKIDLLKKLLSDNSDKSIIVVSSYENTQLSELSSKSVTIIDDKSLYQDKGLKAELIISFDLPEQFVVYVSRLSHTTEAAAILVSKEQENLLYRVETILGRAIKQEILEEFSNKPKQKEKKEPNNKKKAPVKKSFSKNEKEKKEPKKTGRSIKIDALKKKD